MSKSPFGPLIHLHHRLLITLPICCFSQNHKFPGCAAGRAAGQGASRQQQQVVETIVREQPKIGRNDKVIIKHVMSGESKEVKYKQAIPLIEKGEWVLVND